MIEIIDSIGRIVQGLFGLLVALLCIISLWADPKPQPLRWAKVLSAVFGVAIAILAVTTFWTGKKISEEKDKRLQDSQASLFSGRQFMSFLFLRQQQHGLGLLPVGTVLQRQGAQHGDAYDYRHTRLPTTNEVVVKLAQDPDLFYYSYFECLFLAWMTDRYNHHWTRKDEYETSIGFGGGSSHHARDLPATRWTREDIRVAFSNNPLVSLQSPQYYTYAVALPPDTQVSTTSSSKMGREITFTNAHMSLTIDILGRPSRLMSDFDKQAYRHDDHFPQYATCYYQRVEVWFECKFVPEECFSDLAVEQHEWIEGMIKRFRKDFEWSLVKNDLKSLPVVMKQESGTAQQASAPTCPLEQCNTLKFTSAVLPPLRSDPTSEKS